MTSTKAILLALLILSCMIVSPAFAYNQPEPLVNNTTVISFATSSSGTNTQIFTIGEDCILMGLGVYGYSTTINDYMFFKQNGVEFTRYYFPRTNQTYQVMGSAELPQNKQFYKGDVVEINYIKGAATQSFTDVFFKTTKVSENDSQGLLIVLAFFSVLTFSLMVMGRNLRSKRQ